MDFTPACFSFFTLTQSTSRTMSVAPDKVTSQLSGAITLLMRLVIEQRQG